LIRCNRGLRIGFPPIKSRHARRLALGFRAPPQTGRCSIWLMLVASTNFAASRNFSMAAFALGSVA
jgi:hypothetical protein